MYKQVWLCIRVSQIGNQFNMCMDEWIVQIFDSNFIFFVFEVKAPFNALYLPCYPVVKTCIICRTSRTLILSQPGLVTWEHNSVQLECT